VASSDHDFGTSTFSCLKITLPASSVIFGGALFPFDLVERLDFRIAENAFNRQDFFPGLLPPFYFPRCAQFCGAAAANMRSRSQNFLACVNHDCPPN